MLQNALECSDTAQFNMDFKMRRLTFFLNLVFLICFLVHIMSIGYTLKYPEYPSTVINNKELKDIEFPISFQLCIKELENVEKRYRNIGYKNFGDFFKGVSKVRQKWIYIYILLFIFIFDSMVKIGLVGMVILKETKL